MLPSISLENCKLEEEWHLHNPYWILFVKQGCLDTYLVLGSLTSWAERRRQLGRLDTSPATDDSPSFAPRFRWVHLV